MNIRTILKGVIILKRVTTHKRIVLIIGFAFCVLFCSAQAWTYRSDNYVGLSSGQWGNYGLLQTVHGVYHGAWFVGAGAGLDNYRFRSVPLFLSVTRDLPVAVVKRSGLPVKRGGLYVELDGGTNLPWYTRTLEPYEGINSSKFHAAAWWSAGVGYKWKLSAAAASRKALLLSFNYSEKRLKETGTTVSPICYALNCTVVGPNQQTLLYEYLNRVFLFKLGFQF
jgi:hypothetical protein